MLDKEDIKQIIELRQHYRNVFSNSSGKIVMLDMMRRCYFFNDDLSEDIPGAIGKHNFIIETLDILGKADDPSASAEAIGLGVINALLNIPIVDRDNLTNEDN